MQFYFWRYAESWNDISERIRRKQIINTTTVPADLKRSQSGYITSISPELQAKLEPLVVALKEQRTLRPGKKGLPRARVSIFLSNAERNS